MMIQSTLHDTPDWAEVAVGYQRAMRVFENFVRPVLAAHGVERIGMGNALFLYIIGETSRRVSELVREQGYGGSNASYSMALLEKDGLIERFTDADDKRIRRVALTPTGTALYRAMREACRGETTAVHEALRGLSVFESVLSREHPEISGPHEIASVT